MTITSVVLNIVAVLAVLGKQANLYSCCSENPPLINLCFLNLTFSFFFFRCCSIKASKAIQNILSVSQLET